MKGQLKVIEKFLNQCEKAYLAKTPVLYIRTDEIEVIDEIIGSDRLVTRMRNVSTTKGVHNYVPCDPYTQLKDVVNYSFKLPTVKITSDPTDKLGFSWGLTKNYGAFPVIAAVRMGKNLENNAAQFDGLMHYLEDYTREEDDNSSLRCSVVILYGTGSAFPSSLIPYMEYIDVEYPDESDIEEIIGNMLQMYHVADFQDERDMEDMKALLTGFTYVEVRKILRRILTIDSETDEGCIHDYNKAEGIIRNAKEQMLMRGGILELVKSHAGDNAIGGLLEFRKWIEYKKNTLANSAGIHKAFGTDNPKGVLLCGIPGCGKSLAAETLASVLRIPLLKMDVGRLMGRYVGESEQNMHQALKLAEAMSPCILWIDELDKGFSGANSGNSEGSGVFKRMFGTLLTWMQENKKACFIFATANNITGMPKELFRSGRFDELFSIFMPTHDECVDIFSKCMRKAADEVFRLSPEKEKRILFKEACYSKHCLDRLMERLYQINSQGEIEFSRFITGADIQKIVNEALLKIYQDYGTNKMRISEEEWVGAVYDAMKKTTVHGDGIENLDSIAIAYVRLLRKNFRPASERNLFEQSEYKILTKGNGEVSVELTPKPDDILRKWPLYDQVMYKVLWEHIIQIGNQVERIERDLLLRS